MELPLHLEYRLTSCAACNKWNVSRPRYVYLYILTFGNSVEDIQDVLKYYKNNVYFIWRRLYIYDNNLYYNSSYNEHYFRHNCRKNHNTHSVLEYFIQKILSFYNIMLENIVQPDKAQKII